MYTVEITNWVTGDTYEKHFATESEAVDQAFTSLHKIYVKLGGHHNGFRIGSGMSGMPLHIFKGENGRAFTIDVHLKYL